MLRKILLSAVAAVTLVSSSFAQTTAPVQPAPSATAPTTTTPTTAATPKASDDTTTTGSIATGTPTILQRFMPGETMSSKIIGKAVYNTANEKIGDVNDIVFDSSGKVVGIVVGVGGFLGLGEKDIAFAYKGVQITKDAKGNDRIVIAATKDQLKTFPAYDTKAAS